MNIQIKSPILLFILLSNIVACGQSPLHDESETHAYSINKSEEEWKKQLSQEEYHVLREEGTEKPFTGKYVDWKEHGVFLCKACQNPLFSSETKYKSGTGWPSFYDKLNENSLLEKKDNQYGWNRVEIECKQCGSHLGHVFEDGPKPTGLRYCINSVSLVFKKAD